MKTADKLTMAFPEPPSGGEVRIASTRHHKDGPRFLEKNDPAHFNGYGYGSANLEDGPDNLRLLDRPNKPGMCLTLTKEKDAERSRRQRGINTPLRPLLRPPPQQIREEGGVNNPNIPPPSLSTGTQTGTAVPHHQRARPDCALNNLLPSLLPEAQNMRQVPQSLSRPGDEELLRAQIIVDNLLRRLRENRDPNFRRPLIPLLSFNRPGDEEILRAQEIVDNVLSKVRENLEIYSSSK